MQEGQRLDKWLWCARLAKTRTGAQRAIEAGKVRINGTRALKPSRLVQSGDVLTAMLTRKLVVVRVLAAADRRGSAAVARELYEDLTPKPPSEPEAGKRQAGRRPTKRDRRRIDALLNSDP